MEDCTIWIGRLDNPAFGKSMVQFLSSMSTGRISVLTGGSRVRIAGSPVPNDL